MFSMLCGVYMSGLLGIYNISRGHGPVNSLWEINFFILSIPLFNLLPLDFQLVPINAPIHRKITSPKASFDFSLTPLVM